jgi:hypothetical protein
MGMPDVGQRPVAVLDTLNALDWRGNGGDHRALQIAELLERAGLLVRLPGVQHAGFLERHLRSLALWSRRGYPVHYRRREEGIPDRVRQALSRLRGTSGHLVKRYSALFSETPPPSVFLWENSNNTVGAMMAARAGCPVVAVPQNIYTAERGFRDYWLGKRGLAALGRELDFLRSCSAAFCISREEQWLLRVQGIEADHLPYYPPRKLAEFLVAVRRDRQPGAERRFLLLGTAVHPPTEQSLREQVALLSSMPWSRACRVDVAGQGTERLRASVEASNVVIHGTVSQEQLRDLLVRASAAIVHQRPSVGALTRIPELLLAGVPVLANVDASRSTWGVAGVIHYESSKDLEEMAQGAFPVPPPPERPVQAEGRFCRVVEGLASSRARSA